MDLKQRILNLKNIYSKRYLHKCEPSNLDSLVKCQFSDFVDKVQQRIKNLANVTFSISLSVDFGKTRNQIPTKNPSQSTFFPIKSSIKRQMEQ